MLYRQYGKEAVAKAVDKYMPWLDSREIKSHLCLQTSNASGKKKDCILVMAMQ